MGNFSTFFHREDEGTPGEIDWIRVIGTGNEKEREREEGEEKGREGARD